MLWNEFLEANIAFFERDLDTLKRQREQLARGSDYSPNRKNLRVVDSLIAHFNQSYEDAYSATPSE